jgi:threonine/homoserine/homoserine lactone efflux protein
VEDQRDGLGQADGHEHPVILPGAFLAFARGAGIGVAVAAPIGPMSLLCMRRTLVQGARFGLGTGAGIAAGDALYALVAALGLAGVMRFMVAHQRPLHVIAGGFLLYLGWRTFFAAPSPTAAAAPPAVSPVVAAVGALLLTLTNPPTIVSFVAIFTAVAPAGFGPADAAAMAAGVFTGSLLWWVLVTAAVSAARHALAPEIRRWLDRISGAVLGALGIAEIRRAA